MSSEPFTVRADKKKLKALDRLAARRDRSRNYLVNEAIDHFLELQEWQAERVREGIKAADGGRFANDREMDRILKKYKDD